MSLAGGVVGAALHVFDGLRPRLLLMSCSTSRVDAATLDDDAVALDDDSAAPHGLAFAGGQRIAVCHLRRKNTCQT